jgi:hypothetical protein
MIIVLYFLVSSKSESIGKYVPDKYALRSSEYSGSIMISLCDAELVGKKLDCDGLTINIAKSYWQQRLVDDYEAESLLRKCNIANLAGKNIVEKAINTRMANPASVKIFSGVPFLMIYRFTRSY